MEFSQIAAVLKKCMVVMRGLTNGYTYWIKHITWNTMTTRLILSFLHPTYRCKDAASPENWYSL